MATAIVFDLDGTLADSTGCIIQAYNRVGQTLRLSPVEDRQIQTRIGLPLRTMLAELYNLQDSHLEEAASIYSSEYLKLVATEEQLFEGALNMLHRLRQANFKLAIATGKSQRGAVNACTRLGLMPLVETVHGILPGTPGKPDPAVLRRAVVALGVEPENCIMIGDTTFDLDMAKSMNIRSAAVTWGVHNIEQLRGSEPSFIAANTQELQSWLLTLR